MKSIQQVEKEIVEKPRKWLITGVAGFIGSNLLEYLLKKGQRVIGIDNFSTGYLENLNKIKSQITPQQWDQFEFIQGDICDIDVCHSAMRNVEIVLHQAALGSVPRSIKDPVSSNAANISGFVNVIFAAKEAGVQNLVYAASSSTYGDHAELPKVEDVIGKPLSPYAVTKYVNELYADVFSRVYNFHSVGLRYFNVFGKMQNLRGEYSAVIPKWINSMVLGETIVIFGDGSTSRDFCFIDNVIQANVLAAVSGFDKSKVFNVAHGEQTSLITLEKRIRNFLCELGIKSTSCVKFESFRKGDVLHSKASIKNITSELNYSPSVFMEQGLKHTVKWYVDNALLDRRDY